MSIGAGPLGYPDGQRLSSWDLGAVLFSLNTLQTGTFTSPGINVGHFGYAYSFMSVAGNPVQAQFNWFQDSGLTVLSGSRNTKLTTTASRGSQFIHTNLGRFLQILLIPLTGATTYTPSLVFIPTNRSWPWLTYPSDSFLFDAAPSLAASASTNVFLGWEWAGPVSVSAFGGSQGINVLVQHYNFATGLIGTLFGYSVAASAYDNRTIISPGVGMQFNIANASAVNPNNTATFTGIASLTGST